MLCKPVQMATMLEQEGKCTFVAQEAPVQVSAALYAAGVCQVTDVEALQH